MLFDGGFTFPNFLADVFALFIFVLWFWLLVTVASDLFRRDDVSGLAKVLWVILLIVLPYVGIFAYMLTQGRGMTARHDQRARQSRDALRNAIGLSVADEIEKLSRLKASGVISDSEYSRLKAKLVE
jgi:predicted membrane channel-forming protein YqfA (hemolysin III family)